MGAEEAQRNRSLMWEIYTYDSWMVRLSQIRIFQFVEVIPEPDVWATELFPSIID